MIAGARGLRRVMRPGVLLVVAVIVGVTASIEAQQPSFSARADYVRVDVEVRHNNAVVAGLTAGDFEVLDNGVPQRVEIVAPSAYSVSVVLALDMSSSLDQKARAHLIGAGTRVVDALKPGESAALLTFNERVTIRSTFTTDVARLRELVAAPAPSGDTALYDAAHTAMLVGTAAPGRSIVILFSDGDDTASLLTEDAIVETARRTGSVVCVVTLGGEDTPLQQLTSTTGGIFLREKSLDRVAARFAELLQRFRERYLLSFAPTGVDKPGWHKLTVRVKGGGDVRARTGYWGGS
jgi:VWFA-related protein